MAEPTNNTPTDNLSKYLLPSDAVNQKRQTTEVEAALSQVPLTLQPFFKEDSDLNRELVQRFPTMPLMSTVRFRDIYEDGERGMATLASSDGSASLVVDVTSKTSEIQFAFMFGSMLSLRFHMNELSDLDRRVWLNNMANYVKVQKTKDENSGKERVRVYIETYANDVVFLWGQSRWAKDYVICVPHQYYISLLAFSSQNFEAAVRLTPQISADLLAWLRKFWYQDEEIIQDIPNDGNSAKPDNNTPDILSEW